MTRRENTNKLGQYFVLDIRHTIYGSIIGMSLCGFSHNKLKNYMCFFQSCMSVKGDILSSAFSIPFHYATYFPSRISISFHYSTYFSSAFSISFHYSTFFSSIFSISFHYSTYFSSIFSISFHY
jgi:hypothetical protein